MIYDAAGAERSRTFDRAADARAFEAKVRTLKRAAELAELEAGEETLAEFAAEWWEQYAIGSLARTRSRATPPRGTPTCSRTLAPTA